MSRRRPKRTIPWTADWAEAFIAPATWSPPATLTVWKGARRTTVVGLYLDDAGRRVRATVRLAGNDGDGFTVLESSISMAFTFRERALA